MFRIALAVPLAALVAGPLPAKDHVGLQIGGDQRATYSSAANPNTVIVNAPTLASWSANVSRSLGAAMRYPHFFSNELPVEGTARVRFACSPSGTPAGLELVRSSGDRRIDRAAFRAIMRLKTLHPLPAGLSADQHYVAAVVFATSQESLKRQVRAIRDEQAARADARLQDIALLVSPHRIGG